MNTLINEIKTLATQQVELKNQKKTVNLIGPRTIDPSKATYYHLHNRTKLRQMYMALGLLKGRDMIDVESNSKSIININAVNALVKKYENEFRNTEQLCSYEHGTSTTDILLQSGGTKGGE